MFTSNPSDVSNVVAELRPLRVENNQCRNVAIETLSDDVLLEIFYLCPDEVEDFDPWYDPGNEADDRHLYDAWYALAHVCRRWRHVVFASPRRLNLRIHCSRRRVREMLGVWPAFPIIIWNMPNLTSDEDNIIATLEHRDRVCEIRLGRLTRLQSEKLVPLMQESFPALTKLQIESYSSSRDGQILVLPDSFLGGSAPHLRFLCLAFVSFPAFPNLLLSASNLVHLYLNGTPSGYISAEMVTALSTLSKLEVMHLFFCHPVSDSDLENPAPPPLIRSVLPALKVLEFGGDGRYLDDFAARIDIPSIIYLTIEFTNRPFYVHDFFHIPQFIGRVENRSFDYAEFDLLPSAMDITLSPGPQRTRDFFPGELKLKFLCDTGDPLASLVAALNTLLLPLSNIENFAICTQFSYWDSPSGLNTGDPQWLGVLRQISAAKRLYLGLVTPVAFALNQVIEEGMTDVLPAIQELNVSSSLSAGPVREAIEQFVTARGLSAFETPGSSKWRISARDT